MDSGALCGVVSVSNSCLCVVRSNVGSVGSSSSRFRSLTRSRALAFVMVSTVLMCSNNSLFVVMVIRRCFGFAFLREGDRDSEVVQGFHVLSDSTLFTGLLNDTFVI